MRSRAPRRRRRPPRQPRTGTPPPVAVDVGARDAAPVEPRQRKDTSPETAQAKRRAEESRAKTDPPKAPLDPAAAAAAEKAEKLAKKKSAERTARLAGALAAFGYALLFALAGAGAGYAATLGAHELVAHGHVLPLIGTKTRLVFPIVLGVVGVLAGVARVQARHRAEGARARRDRWAVSAGSPGELVRTRSTAIDRCRRSRSASLASSRACSCSG